MIGKTFGYSSVQPINQNMYDSRVDWTCDDRDIPTWSKYRE